MDSSKWLTSSKLTDIGLTALDLRTGVPCVSPEGLLDAPPRKSLNSFRKRRLIHLLAPSFVAHEAVRSPVDAACSVHRRKRLSRAGMASMRALRVSTWASSASSFCAMRFCSAAGGTGTFSSASFPRAIRFLVVPEALREISSRIGEALSVCINQRWLISRLPERKTATSTTVRQRCGRLGIRHARPRGSGIRASKMSPSSSAVQFNRSNVSSLT